jgi:hypothetical protein
MRFVGRTRCLVIRFFYLPLKTILSDYHVSFAGNVEGSTIVYCSTMFLSWLLYVEYELFFFFFVLTIRPVLLHWCFPSLGPL